MSYEEALEQALNLTGNEKALEAFLAGAPEWEARLRAALQVTQALQVRSEDFGPDAVTTARVEGAVLAAVSARAHQPRRGWPNVLQAAYSLLPRPRLVLAAGTMALVLAIVSLIALPLVRGNTQSAQALVLRGSISELGASMVTVDEGGHAVGGQSQRWNVFHRRRG